MDYKSKVAKIYEVMADKTLSFGCMFYTYHWRLSKVISRDYDDKWQTGLYRCIDDWLNAFWVKKIWALENIIWHPLHIWHVLDWLIWLDKKVIINRKMEWETEDELIQAYWEGEAIILTMHRDTEVTEEALQKANDDNNW